ncbi:GIY-YIG nuclease family protein [Oscillospiraceae bacterium CM]|nr:GIY-YIG nuclease family protein [Oscillospiraceae bacterium CM]
MDKEHRKQQITDYKERQQTGGVFIIKNTVNGKVLLDAAPDILAAQNRFEFAKQMNSCVTPKLKADWEKDSATAFTFQVLETLDKSDTQTAEQFRDDLKVLKELWRDKFSLDLLY